MGSVFHNLFTELYTFPALVTAKGDAQSVFASSRGTFGLPELSRLYLPDFVIKYPNLPEASLIMQGLICWLK